MLLYAVTNKPDEELTYGTIEDSESDSESDSDEEEEEGQHFLHDKIQRYRIRVYAEIH